MPKVFISYRREDSADISLTIYENLMEALGERNVFFDVDAIPPGVNFAEHIRGWIDQADVFLAVIGERWNEAKNGRPRLDNPHDFVRIEIEAALARATLTIIPILVGRAEFPSSDSLPVSLKELCTRNAAEVRPGRDRRMHLVRLVEAIRSIPRHPQPRISGIEETVPFAEPSILESVVARRRQRQSARDGLSLSNLSGRVPEPDEIRKWRRNVAHRKSTISTGKTGLWICLLLIAGSLYLTLAFSWWWSPLALFLVIFFCAGVSSVRSDCRQLREEESKLHELIEQHKRKPAESAAGLEVPIAPIPIESGGGSTSQGTAGDTGSLL